MEWFVVPKGQETIDIVSTAFTDFEPCGPLPASAFSKLGPLITQSGRWSQFQIAGSLLCQYASEMKRQSWRTDTKPGLLRLENSFRSLAVFVLIIGYIVELAISPELPIGSSPGQTCTVIVECLRQPLVLHTNPSLYRAAVIVLKSELKFLGHLPHCVA